VLGLPIIWQVIGQHVGATNYLAGNWSTESNHFFLYFGKTQKQKKQFYSIMASRKAQIFLVENA